MRIWTNRWAYLIALALPLVSLEAKAARLSDGNVYFTHPPNLVSSSVTETQTFAWNSLYYFTLSLPPDAGEPLQRVAIAQRDGSTAVRQIHYDLNATRAVLGNRYHHTASLTLGTTTYDQPSQTVVVNFDPPVPPGSTVTIELHPERNPQIGGTYLLGVTAFPAGDPAHGQFLGFGRFQFDEPDNSLAF